MPPSGSAAASAALGALLAAVAFAARGGTTLSSTTAVEVVLICAAGLVGGLLALRIPRPALARVDGLAPLALFAVLALLTALSTAWSIAPGESVEEGGRTFAYLAVFALALVAAHVWPRSAPAAVAGIVLAGTVVCGWALLTRVFPGAFAEVVLGARLGEPFGYWNALGAMAALTIPAALWLGSRRDGPRLGRALAYPAMGVLLLALLLTQSRGALAAAVVAALLWLALTPLRLRTLPVLILPAVVIAPVAAWALSRDAFTEILQPLATREAVAGELGLMLLAVCVVLLGAGLAVETLSRRHAPSPRARRRTGLAVAAAACALALAALGSVALSDRGLAGTISDRVTELTSETAATPAGAARLGSISSSRGQYWRQAAHVFAERPVFGRGANSFGLARLLYRKDGRAAAHAHGFVAQTLADLGLAGGVCVLALLVAWLAAAARSTGFLPRRAPHPEWTAERGALTALALCAIAFGVHSTIDWTWFVPGPTVAALVAAGFVAGRGPLPAVGRRPEPPPATSSPSSRSERLRRLLRRRPLDRLRLAAAGAIVLTAALCAWAAYQPERAARAADRAYELLGRGELAAASRQGARARELDPYTAPPLWAQAAVLARRQQPAAAYRTLERAVIEHPRDPATWTRLASFELDTLDLPARAVETLGAALQVDPLSQRIPLLIQRAQAALPAVPPAAAPAPAPGAAPAPPSPPPPPASPPPPPGATPP